MISRLVAGVALMAGLALAHGVDYRVVESRGVVALEWRYESQSAAPAKHAQVKVYSPADASKEYMTGQTDARGLFVFLPDRPGEWRVEVDDNEGHRETAKITVTEAGTAQAAESHSHGADGGVSQTAITGVSVLFGAAGLLYGWTRRRQSA